MNKGLFIWVLMLVFTLTAGLTDWRSRKIPNWLTLPGIMSGITVHAILNGWRGAGFSLLGIAVALLLLMPLVFMRGLGAGDWKLMGVVGAFLGWKLFLFVLLGSIFAAGLMAAVQVCRAGRITETLKNIFTLIRGFFTFGLVKNPQISLENPHLLKVPFGVAVAAATLVCFYAANFIIVR